jgi:hypothetical protein
VGFTEYFIIEQDESGFRAMTVRARGAIYPTPEEAKRHCETEPHPLEGDPRGSGTQGRAHVTEGRAEEAAGGLIMRTKAKPTI